MHVWFERTRLALQLLRAGVAVLHSDSDALWFKNPLPELARLAESNDLMFARGNAAAGRNSGPGAGVCMGFYFARATNASAATFEAALRRIVNTNSADQPAVNAVLWPGGVGRDRDALKPEYWRGESPVTQAKFVLLPQTRFPRHAGKLAPTGRSCRHSAADAVRAVVWLAVRMCARAWVRAGEQASAKQRTSNRGFGMRTDAAFSHCRRCPPPPPTTHTTNTGAKLLDYDEGLVDIHIFHPVDSGYGIPLHLLPVLLNPATKPTYRNSSVSAKEHCGVGKWFERIVWRKREQQIQACMGLWLLRKFFKYGTRHWPPLSDGQSFAGWLESVSYLTELASAPRKPALLSDG